MCENDYCCFCKLLKLYIDSNRKGARIMRKRKSSSRVLAVIIVLVGFNMPAYSGTYYYVAQTFGSTNGIVNDSANPWNTIQGAYDQLVQNENGSLSGKGQFIIQIRDSAKYSESVVLGTGGNELTTTSNDTLTICRNLNLAITPVINGGVSGPAIKVGHGSQNDGNVSYLTIDEVILNLVEIERVAPAVVRTTETNK